MPKHESSLAPGEDTKDSGTENAFRSSPAIEYGLDMAWNTNASQSSITVSCRHSFSELSVADANQIDFAVWWIARVNVHRKYRGKGYGSKLLNALVDEIFSRGGLRIEVAPGGYGEDPEKQYAFYMKNGFVRDEENPDLLVRELDEVEDSAKRRERSRAEERENSKYDRE